MKKSKHKISDKILSLKIRNIALVIIFSIVIVSLFFPMLKTSTSVSSSTTTYRLVFKLEYTYQYVSKCGYSYDFMTGSYTFKCGYVYEQVLTPVQSYEPVWTYNTVFFHNDMEFYDLILSSFRLGKKQMFFVIPIMSILFIGSFFTYSRKKAKSAFGLICLAMFNILIFAALICVLRINIVNPEVSEIDVGFYLIAVAAFFLLILAINNFIYLIKKNHKDKTKAIIARMVVFILLLVLSEVSIASLYGFLLYLFMISGLIISFNNNYLCKALGLISTIGIFAYSAFTLTRLLVKGIGEFTFLELMPVDSIIFRLLDLVILLIMLVLLKKEIRSVSITKRASLLAASIKKEIYGN